MNSPGRQVRNMLLEISGEITPERMKRRNQSKKQTNNNNNKKKHPVVDMSGDGS